MTVRKRIEANRVKHARHKQSADQLDTELTAIVKGALEAGEATWKEIADWLGVSKARVYQIRDGRR